MVKNNPIYVNNGIVQKVISAHDYDVMLICKNSTIEELQEYYKEYYGNEHYLDSASLYKVLVQTFLNICSTNDIEIFLKYNLSHYYELTSFMNKDFKGINYIDLVNMIRTKIQLLQVRETVNNHLIDLFLIELDDNSIVDIDDYDLSNRNKVKKK